MQLYYIGIYIDSEVMRRPMYPHCSCMEPLDLQIPRSESPRNQPAPSSTLGDNHMSFCQCSLKTQSTWIQWKGSTKGRNKGHGKCTNIYIYIYERYTYLPLFVHVSMYHRAFYVHLSDDSSLTLTAAHMQHVCGTYQNRKVLNGGTRLRDVYGTC